MDHVLIFGGEGIVASWNNFRSEEDNSIIFSAWVRFLIIFLQQGFLILECN